MTGHPWTELLTAEKAGLEPRHRATWVAVPQDAACELPSEPVGSRYRTKFNPRVAQVLLVKDSWQSERPSSDKEAQR